MMMSGKNQSTLASMFDVQNFMYHLGVEAIKCDGGCVEVTLDYKDELSSKRGVFHNGVLGALVDMVANAVAKEAARSPTEFNIAEQKLNMFAPAVGERLIVTGTAVKAGRTLTIVDANIYVMNGSTRNHVAMALITLVAK